MVTSRWVKVPKVSKSYGMETSPWVEIPKLSK